MEKIICDLRENESEESEFLRSQIRLAANRIAKENKINSSEGYSKLCEILSRYIINKFNFSNSLSKPEMVSPYKRVGNGFLRVEEGSYSLYQIIENLTTKERKLLIYKF